MNSLGTKSVYHLSCGSVSESQKSGRGPFHRRSFFSWNLAIRYRKPGIATEQRDDHACHLTRLPEDILKLSADCDHDSDRLSLTSWLDAGEDRSILRGRVTANPK